MKKRRVTPTKISPVGGSSKGVGRMYVPFFRARVCRREIKQGITHTHLHTLFAAKIEDTSRSPFFPGHNTFSISRQTHRRRQRENKTRRIKQTVCVLSNFKVRLRPFARLFPLSAVPTSPHLPLAALDNEVVRQETNTERRLSFLS